MYSHFLSEIEDFCLNVTDFTFYVLITVMYRLKWVSDNKCEKKRKAVSVLNLLKPTGHVMQQQFKIQQLYALSTLYLCVLYLSENKQRLVPLTA